MYPRLESSLIQSSTRSDRHNTRNPPPPRVSHDKSHEEKSATQNDATTKFCWYDPLSDPQPRFTRPNRLKKIMLDPHPWLLLRRLIPLPCFTFNSLVLSATPTTACLTCSSQTQTPPATCQVDLIVLLGWIDKSEAPTQAPTPGWVDKLGCVCGCTG